MLIKYVREKQETVTFHAIKDQDSDSDLKNNPKYEDMSNEESEPL